MAALAVWKSSFKRHATHILILPYFLARKIIRSSEKSFPRMVRKVAVFNVVVGIAGTLMAFFILRGFERHITQKIYDVVGHLHVTRHAWGGKNHLSLQEPFYRDYQQGKMSQVAVMYPFLHAAAMLRSAEGMVGTVVKGTTTHHQAAFAQYVVRGQMPDFSSEETKNEILISEKMARTLAKEVGDPLVVRFLQSPPRLRKLTIAGIYNTQLVQEFDEKVAVANLRLLQEIHNLTENEAEGVEIFLKDRRALHGFYKSMYHTLDSHLYPELIKRKYARIFDWLALIQNNAFLFVGLIAVISCFNMVSTFLILTMERYRMIGLLKAVGGGRRLIESVFLHYATLLIVRGMIWGNALAFATAGIQYLFKPIQLDPASYSVGYLPIAWDFQAVIVGNVLIFLFLQLSVSLPIRIASRQTTLQTLQFSR